MAPATTRRPRAGGQRDMGSNRRSGRTIALWALASAIPIYALVMFYLQNAQIMQGGGKLDIWDMREAFMGGGGEEDVGGNAPVGGGGGDGGGRKRKSGGAARIELTAEDKEKRAAFKLASKLGGIAIISDADWPGVDEAVSPGSILPFDLSVNDLRPIVRAPGAIAVPHLAVEPVEDFLPVVTPSDISFRWRSQTVPGSEASHASYIKAYRIAVHLSETGKESGEGKLVWDSEIVVLKGVPASVEWGAAVPPTIGNVLEWRVTLFDAERRARSSSWSRFAVGPDKASDWSGTDWIVHPSDMDAFDSTKVTGKMPDDCDRWKQRRALPVFRGRISRGSLLGENQGGEIKSVLLVVAGLGSFRASVNGVPLSSSGPIDPPFTDYTKRVSYRGFDVTPFLAKGNDKTKLDPQGLSIGLTMGSGWWDHRPINTGMAKFKLLPRGPATVRAQIYVTYSDGTTRVVGPTRHSEKEDYSVWQVARGHIRESDLFTGETVDLAVLRKMEGWDTVSGWTPVANKHEKLLLEKQNPVEEVNHFIHPVAYRTNITQEQRRQEIAVQAKAMDRNDAKGFPKAVNFAAPIGKLIPNEIPPVMPMERVEPDEVFDLGSGRWLVDFGKAISGVIHFGEGLPVPMENSLGEYWEYPRAHGFRKATLDGDAFLTVVHGEGLEMTTGDINRVLTAGLGLHDGGPRHVSKKEFATARAPCFPEDHDYILSQRDVYVVPNKTVSDAGVLFAKARQSHFTTHAFRFAEICCTAEPPKGMQALMYRTAFNEWGSFDSSSVSINGGYELVKNAMNANMLSVQSDCPHREKLPYGGDLVADSPAAMHMYDMSAFYRKTIQDWLDAQWDNGAYTETSVWQNLNDYAGIGQGAGETVWASAPPVITVRHFQHYEDTKLLKNSIEHHERWLAFLEKNFDAGMEVKGYDNANLTGYTGQKSGLGDWLGLKQRDTFLTHTGFFMASGRCVAYIARKLKLKGAERRGMEVANKIRDRISYLYLKNGKDNFDFPHGSASSSPGPEMSLFSRIVPGEKRCVVLKNWFKREGHTWPGDEEMRFIKEVDESTLQGLVESGEITKRGNKWAFGWSQWQGFNEGIFAIRYALKALSDMGFHNVALRKATGFGFATFDYLLSHNATTMWESWWRSEDLYSRNHPMLGAMAEWMSSSVAGLSLHPTTTGGRNMLFWPRFPKSAATLQYASATQGSPRGDFAIAWEFVDLPDDKSKYDSAEVKIRIRLIIPPGATGVVRLPVQTKTKTTITRAKIYPNVLDAQFAARSQCETRRKDRLGFPYSWEFDKDKKQWYKLESGKAIGTPCESFLFHYLLDSTQWSEKHDISDKVESRTDYNIGTGMFEIMISGWTLEKEVEGKGRLGNIPEYSNKAADVGPYCNDKDTWEWDIEDATHLI